MRYYVQFKMKGRGFNCIGCTGKKCLFEGRVKILTYQRGADGKRIEKVINNVDEMFTYIDEATQLLQSEGQDPTEFDLVWAGHGHGVCPIPLLDIETIQLNQAIDFAGKTDPRDVLKVPAYFVQVKNIIDAENGRMDRIYAK